MVKISILKYDAPAFISISGVAASFKNGFVSGMNTANIKTANTAAVK